ncbi:uncharacterized protein EV154DRAFT_488206 [Mucor mucedo]|uniref:uncharacterized protein n=1 Tax=Mucor mucedo TaxID=29922 RepID=UPI00221F5610|nr:uncharacterized protein EV154DRAFT_488206 [Mucor mucedo]KAI7868058.1 hypothetical protein EV154DRAFT_488206 [Mucor mucedo]
MSVLTKIVHYMSFQNYSGADFINGQRPNSPVNVPNSANFVRYIDRQSLCQLCDLFFECSDQVEQYDNECIAPQPPYNCFSLTSNGEKMCQKEPSLFNENSGLDLKSDGFTSTIATVVASGRNIAVFLSLQFNQKRYLLSGQSKIGERIGSKKCTVNSGFCIGESRSKLGSLVTNLANISMMFQSSLMATSNGRFISIFNFVRLVTKIYTKMNPKIIKSPREKMLYIAKYMPLFLQKLE